MMALPAEGSAQADFLPSRHGLRFGNTFGWKHAAGRLPQVTYGLCGGMALYAAECYRRPLRVPARTAPPPLLSSLHRTLVARQWRTLGAGQGWQALRRFVADTRRPDADLLRAADAAAEALTPRLAQGELAVLGLLLTYRLDRLWEHHQVLAYRATPAAVQVYDPNHPGRDDVRLRREAEGWALWVGTRRLKPVRGFFVTTAC